MKTKSRIIAVLSILLLCAGLFVACSADVADSAAAEAGKTAYLDFGGASKSIDASSISQSYTIKPVSEVYWVYKATKADHAGSTGATGGSYLPVTTFTEGLDGTVGPFSVGKWTFDLIGYVGCVAEEGDIPSGEDARAVTINGVTKYYYGTIYEAHSAIITLSESTSDNPQVVSVDVVFAGEGTGTVYIHEGFFYWKDDNGGDVELDGKVLKMHLTMRPTLGGSAIEKYIVLDAVAYNDTIGQGYRYSPASGQDVLFVIPAGDYETDFAIEKWSTGDGAALESTLSGASDVTVTVYSKQELKIDAQFLESVFGYVTFDGITPSPVLVQRLVLKTDTTSLTVSETQTVTHDGLSVTYPDGTKLSEGTKEAEDGKTADAKTGFVYENTNPPVDPSTQQTIDIGTGNSNLKYELTLNVDTTNTTVLTVTKNIGTGRDVQTVYHNGSQMNVATGSTPVAETYSYDSATGILTLYVTHASPIDVVYKPAEVTDVIATIGDKSYPTLRAAVDAAVANDTIILAKSTKITERFEISGKTITLDMNGNNITFTPSGSHPAVLNNEGMIRILGGSNVTITGNGSMSYTGEDADWNAGYCFMVYGDSTLTIKNGTYNANCTIAQAGGGSPVSAGTVVIEDGSFSTDGVYDNKLWTLNLKDNSNSSITVYGGSFKNFDPSNGNTENPNANFVASGYQVIQNQQGSDTYYVVQEIPEIPVLTVTKTNGTTQTVTVFKASDYNDSDKSALDAGLDFAFDNKGGTSVAVLGKDVELTGTYMYAGDTTKTTYDNKQKYLALPDEELPNVEIDLNGHCLTFPNSSAQCNLKIVNANVIFENGSIEGAGWLSVIDHRGGGDVTAREISIIGPAFALCCGGDTTVKNDLSGYDVADLVISPWARFSCFDDWSELSDEEVCVNVWTENYFTAVGTYDTSVVSRENHVIIFEIVESQQ